MDASGACEDLGLWAGGHQFEPLWGVSPAEGP